MNQSRGTDGKGRVMELCSMLLRQICGTLDLTRRNMNMAVENHCHEIIQAMHVINPMPIAALNSSYLTDEEQETYKEEYKRISSKLELLVGQNVGRLDFRAFVKYHLCVLRMEGPVCSGTFIHFDTNAQISND